MFRREKFYNSKVLAFAEHKIDSNLKLKINVEKKYSPPKVTQFSLITSPYLQLEFSLVIE